MATSSIHPAQSNTACAPGGIRTDEQQPDTPAAETNTPASAVMGHWDVSTAFISDVQAYHKKFTEWNCAKICRTALKALADYVILPVARVGIVAAACLCFPATMLMGLSYHEQYVDALSSEAVSDYMDHYAGTSLDIYASQVRIAADQLAEKRDRNCCTIVFCDTILPWLFLPLGIRMLVKQFDIWCGAASAPAEQYLYSKKAPLSEREKVFFSDRGYSDEHHQPFPAAYSLYAMTSRVTQAFLRSDKTNTGQHPAEEDDSSSDSSTSLSFPAKDRPPRLDATGEITAGQVAANQKSDETPPADDPASPTDEQDKQEAHITAGQVAANQKSDETPPADDPASPADKQDKQEVHGGHDGPLLASATLNPTGSPAPGDQPPPAGSQTGDTAPPKATA